jgi:hypothetical protein
MADSGRELMAFTSADIAVRRTLTGRWTRFLVLPRYAWRTLYEQRLVLLLTMAAFIWPLLCAASFI